MSLLRKLFLLYIFLGKFFGVLLLDAPALNVPLPPRVEERRFKITFYCSDKRCCGRHSPQRGGNGNTATGHAPVPFRTVATGDPTLLGKWIFLEDLHGWVYASDTGAPCTKRAKKRFGCVAKNQLDVFIGGAEYHKAALRLGVMEWTGKVAQDPPAEFNQLVSR